MTLNDIILLKLIDVNGSMSLLINKGLSYSQIALMIRNLEEEKCIAIVDGTFELTTKGKDVIKDNLHRIDNNDKKHWILPQRHLYTESISFDKIVLPDRI